MPEIRKQISIFIPISEWRAMRHEAARLHIPITELCRRWMRADMDQLYKEFAHRTAQSADPA